MDPLEHAKARLAKGEITLEEFEKIDTTELSKQVEEVSKLYNERSKNILLLPPTFSPENLSAYLKAKWSNMKDQYKMCYVPWVAVDITASGNVAPCHVFYDLIMGNLHNNTLKEIWNGEKFRKFRNYMENYKFMPICQGCCILYLSGKRLSKRKARN